MPGYDNPYICIYNVMKVTRLLHTIGHCKCKIYWILLTSLIWHVFDMSVVALLSHVDRLIQCLHVKGIVYAKLLL